MKALKIIIGLLFFSISADAQVAQKVKTWYDYDYNLFERGLGIPPDTFPVPARYQARPHIAYTRDSAIWVWAPSLARWAKAGNDPSALKWQDTLTHIATKHELANYTLLQRVTDSAFTRMSQPNDSTARFHRLNGEYQDFQLIAGANGAKGFTLSQPNDTTIIFNYTDGTKDSIVFAGSGSSGGIASESDPVALAKTVSVNGNTQALSANPSFTVAATTTDNNLTVSGMDVSTKKAVQSLTDGATITMNAASGYNATVTLGGTGRTISITNPQAGQYYLIKLVQDGTGSRTVTTWPTGTKWEGGTVPTLSTAAGAIDCAVFFYDGTNYLGRFIKGFN